jgi:gamma-butyrobetaine dioxygenase
MQDLTSPLKDAVVVEGGLVLTVAHLPGQGHGSATPLSSYWLRDNCPCPACRHPGNGQKLYDITELPDDLSVCQALVVAGDLLQVTWSDGHRSSYTRQWLAAHDVSAPARAARRTQPQLWRADIASQLPSADWPTWLADPAAELAWLERYTALGFAILHKVPAQSAQVVAVGNRLGFVRVTNYGVYFDVKSVPQPSNMAYTAVGLGVHSDNPYRHPSPGIQLLHCLQADAPGGDTLLVDGFAAADVLRQADPAAFALLTQVPMNFRYANADTELVARQTLISLDAEGSVVAVHFNNRSADWLDAPAEVAGPWYAAYRQFARILQRPALTLTLRLAVGDCLVMQNDRTLHGRTAFDPSQGVRHLQGCYIDRDALESRRQVLRRGTA